MRSTVSPHAICVCLLLGLLMSAGIFSSPMDTFLHPIYQKNGTLGNLPNKISYPVQLMTGSMVDNLFIYFVSYDSSQLNKFNINTGEIYRIGDFGVKCNSESNLVVHKIDNSTEVIYMSISDKIIMLSPERGSTSVYYTGVVNNDFVIYENAFIIANRSSVVTIFNLTTNGTSQFTTLKKELISEIEIMDNELYLGSYRKSITIVSVSDYTEKRIIKTMDSTYRLRVSKNTITSEITLHFIVYFNPIYGYIKCSSSVSDCSDYNFLQYPTIDAPNVPQFIYITTPCLVSLEDSQQLFYCGYNNITKIENGLSQSFLTLGGAAIEGMNINNFTFTQINSITIRRSLNSRKEMVISDFQSLRTFSFDTQAVNTLAYHSTCTGTPNYRPLSVTQFFSSKEENSLLVCSQDSLSKLIIQESENKLCDYVSYYEHVQKSDRVPANISTLNHPTGLFKHNGEIYFSDSKNHRIRKITTDGFVVNVAGNGYSGYSSVTNPLNSYFNEPNGVVVLQNSDIYIADTKNDCIRRISNGILTTFVGNCASNLSPLKGPYGISFNSTHLFIADSLNHRIVAADFNTATLVTIVGLGTPGDTSESQDITEIEFNSPKGIHVNWPFLFIADTNNHKIKRFNLQSNQLTTLFGSSSTSQVLLNQKTLSYPHAVIGDGNSIVIADSYNSRVISYSPTSSRIMVVGTGEGGYNGDSTSYNIKLFHPKGLAIDSESVYISDSSNNRVRLLSIDFNNLAFSAPTLAGGIGDYGKSLDAVAKVGGAISNSKGEIIFSDFYNHLIRKINVEGIITTIVGKGFGFNGHQVKNEDALLNLPSYMAVSSLNENDFYFCDTGNRLIRKVSNGYVITVAGGGNIIMDGVKATDAQLSYPVSVFITKSEDIFFADYYSLTSYVIKKISHKDGTISRVALDVSYGFTIDEDTGILYANKVGYMLQYLPSCPLGYRLDLNFSLCVPICFGLASYNSSVCSGSGDCISPNKCSCRPNYIGDDCKYPVCYGKDSLDSQVCNGRGSCTSPDTCKCLDGYVGIICEKPICFGKPTNNSCGGVSRGMCVEKDHCYCTEKKYAGNECQYTVCFNKAQNDPSVCNGHGKCTEPDFCDCVENYHGNQCEKYDNSNVILGATLGSLAFLIVFITAISITLGFIVTAYRKQKKIIETDIQLDQRLLLQEDISFTTHSLGSSLSDDKEESFFIPIQDLNLDKSIKRLGAGGMGAVFKSLWKNIPVAVKVFDLNNMNISEEDFLKEATILSKTRHPNVVTFYGVSSGVTKRYIVMECMEGSLESYLSELQNQTLKCSIREKLNLLLQICYGISYLHNLQPNYIVHRDLKPANVLLQNNHSICKLCDFGLGRVLSTHTYSSLTSQIGTSYFMAPEVIMPINEIERSDARAIDIYSLSIIMYQLLFETNDPYSSTNQNYLRKMRLEKPTTYTSQLQLHKLICEEQMRPCIPFNNLESCRKWCIEFDQENNAETYWAITQIIAQCWSHYPSKRLNIEKVIQELEKL